MNRVSVAGATPARLVSLVPSTTESVCELGAAARLVGCTRYCTEPAASLRDVPRIGGTKNPDREALLRLRPELVLANAEENRPEDLEWFAQRVPVLVQTPRTVPEAIAALRDLAARLAADAAVAPFLRALRPWSQPASHDLDAPRVVYVIWRKPWMSVNRDTFVHDVLERCGAVNACADLPERYPEFTPAAVESVDAVLLASEPWAFDEAQRGELAARGTFGTARLVLCDGRDFCWHGTRMVHGLRRVRERIEALGSLRRGG